LLNCIPLTFVTNSALVLKRVFNYPDSIHIVKDFPIFDGIPNPFMAVEINGWLVAVAEQTLPLVDYEN
jgi:hypothetical protein